MPTSKTALLATASLFFALASGAVAEANAKLQVAHNPGPKVQVAILLDTSSSMDGLINQAKSELWSIVNRLAESRRGGRAPTIEVALFEYGKDSIPAGEGYLRMISPLTTDLDEISEELFSLSTNGGSEYAGMVIDRATLGLTWSQKRGDYKAIFIAGNEPFTQGPVPYQKAIARAVGRGIVVNTIHCGDERAGVHGKWQHGAKLGGGSFLTINQNAQVMQIATPYDTELARLSGKLNKTYIAYGRLGKRKARLQKKQDANAASMGVKSVAARAATKGGGAYKNSSWDLVDAEEQGADIGSIGQEQLPPEMAKMSKAERKRYVGKKAKERKALQKKIRRLTAKRSAFVAKKRAKASKEKTLDKAILRTVDGQMKARGYKFKK